MSSSGGTNWHFNQDEGTVTVTFPTVPPVALVLHTKDVEELLKHLGNFRGQMSPPVALEYDVSSPTVQAIPGPAWYSFAESMLGQSVLAMRDPRFGWLHYLLPKEHAKKLATILNSQADQPIAPPPGKAN
jgi:hypothetical protein